MTTKEAVIALLQVSGYSDSSVDLALQDALIDPTAEYDVSFSKSIGRVAIDVLYGMLGVKKVTEGGYSIEYSIEGVKARIAYLSGKYGLPNPLQPIIQNRSYLW